MINDEFLVKLIKTLEESNKKTIEEANKQQTESIKQHIRQEVNELKVKFEEELNKKTAEIENKYKELKSKYSRLEKELKKNNIVIFGLENTTENLGDYVVDTLNHHLQLNLTLNDISNVYTIGKQKDKKPIIVKLLSYLKKYEILRNCKKLKGTNISVAEELTFDEIQESNILRRHLKQARSKNLNAFIKNKKLIINGQEYTAHDLADKVEEEDKDLLNETRKSAVRYSNSAPSTPSTTQQKIGVDEFKEDEVFETEKVGESRKKKTVKVSQSVNKIVRPSRANSCKEVNNTNSDDTITTTKKNNTDIK